MKTFTTAATVVIIATGLWNAHAANTTGQDAISEGKALCRAEKKKLKANIAAAFKDFEAAQTPVPLETLVALDGRLRAHLRDRPASGACESDRDLIYDQRWQQMGVAPGYWNDLVYSGELLLRAHKRAPDSPLRAHTLFSTVFGGKPSRGLGVMPDVEAARGYEREFPTGPFIRDVYAVLADFHKDLFMVLRDRREDYKYRCFARYIGQGSWDGQRDEARRIAIDYYQRLLRLTPGDERVQSVLNLTIQGTIRAWSFCAD
jgi:hypothetical protein